MSNEINKEIKSKMQEMQEMILDLSWDNLVCKDPVLLDRFLEFLEEDKEPETRRHDDDKVTMEIA